MGDLAALAEDVDPAYLDALLATARTLRLWERHEWRVLGHYKGRDVGRWRSQADGPDFFLAPHGKDDPQAELEATLRALFAPPPAPPATEEDFVHREQPAPCRFPSRHRWLDQELGFDRARLPDRPCPALEDWKARLGATGATLVFADAYIDNPASMFGHTFLRLDKGDGGEGSGAQGLLANTVNFAAEAWTSNPLIYPIAGIVGWFPGMYSTLPYYLKVREYNALENRDLWEYPLDLDGDELDRLLDHLWEVGPIVFRYHYFDENCSYQLLTLLEGMDPSLRLSDRYTAWVFPTATLRTVATRSDLVQAPVFRPSRFREMIARRDLLSAEERPLARRLARPGARLDAPALAALPEVRRAAVLDAAYELQRYRAGDEPDEAARAHEQALLVARGRVPVKSAPLSLPAPAPPEAGHRGGMVALGAGVGEGGPFARLRLRPALHDLLAPQQSYVAGTRLEMTHLSLVLPEATGVPRLEQLILFDAASLAPSEPWVTRMAWRLRTGWEPQRHAEARGDCGGRGCLVYGLSGGPGLAWQAGPLLTYGFVEGEAALGAGVDRHLRLGPGAAAGLLLEVAEPVRLHVEGRARYPLWSAAGLLPGAAAVEWLAEGGLALHMARDLELRATGRLLDGAGALAGEGAAEAWLYW